MNRLIRRTVTITIAESWTIVWATKDETADQTMTALYAQQKEQTMYASIRRYKTNPSISTELARLVNEGFVPIISKAPGFVAYYVVDAGNDVAVSITIFHDQAGVAESNRMAADWVKANIAALFVGSFCLALSLAS